MYFHYDVKKSMNFLNFHKFLNTKIEQILDILILAFDIID